MRDSLMTLRAGTAAGVTEESGAKEKSTTLSFVGNLTYETEEVTPASLPDGSKSISGFFALPTARNLLMGSGTGNTVEPFLEVTPNLMTRWRDEAERSGGSVPCDGDEILRVTTKGIQFPGLKLLTVTTMGCKLLPPDPDGSGEGPIAGPGYEFVLIQDEIQPIGSGPLVWAFNRLTGAGKKKKDGSEENDQTTHSLARTIVRPSKGGEEGRTEGAVFVTNARLEVDVSFPSILLKILPVSKEKAEEQGSNSLLKALEKDVGPSVEDFRKEYLRWLEA